MRKYLFLVIAGALLWPAVAKAQPQRGRNARDDRGERITRVIRDCETRTNDFLRAVERAWGRDRHRGDQLDRAASRLEQALNRIRQTWDRDHDFRRTRGNVGPAINAGKNVNSILRHHRLSSNVEREWAAIRSELNNLAEVFEQQRIRW